MTSKRQKTYILKDLKAEKSFQVPEGYFESFPERLQKRIKESKKEETKKSFYHTYFIPQLAIAASFIGLMLLAYSGIKFLTNKQDFKSQNQNSIIADIPDYSLDDLDETTLYEVYNEGGSENGSFNSSGKNETDVMIDYLLLENADIEVLMQQL